MVFFQAKKILRPNASCGRRFRLIFVFEKHVFVQPTAGGKNILSPNADRGTPSPRLIFFFESLLFFQPAAGEKMSTSLFVALAWGVSKIGTPTFLQNGEISPVSWFFQASGTTAWGWSLGELKSVPKSQFSKLSPEEIPPFLRKKIPLLPRLCSFLKSVRSLFFVCSSNWFFA